MRPATDPSAEPLRVLLVDDDEDDFVLTRDLLEEIPWGRFALDWAASYDRGLVAIRSESHDVYLVDYHLGPTSGLDLIREARAGGCRKPLILLTGQGNRSTDVEAMKAGAADYVPKERLDALVLERSIRFALERARHEDALRRVRDELEIRVRERTAELAHANEFLRAEIAERRRAEEDRSRLLERERAARAEAEAANRAKDHFLAMLSHELRTPLNPVLLATSTLIDDPSTPEALLPILEMVRRNIELESRLIDDLLDITRIGQGKLRLAPEFVDVHALIHRAIDICRADVDAGGLRLLVELQAEHHHAEADPARLQQVVWNLVKNAVKFTPAGGFIRVRSRNARPDGRDAPRLVVEVEDSGIGIDPEALSRIFEAFVQVPGPERGPRGGGLGLGLAISRSVIEAHAGRITAQSDGPGKGTRLAIEIPTVRSARISPEAGPPPEAEGSASGPLRILLVEDDPATIAVLGRLLKSDGHRVVSAEGVASALSAFRPSEFDLILSDLGLPDGSGIELLSRLPAGHGVPAVALTGYGAEADVSACRDAGFAAHLTKPIDARRLRDVVRRVGRA